MNILLNRLQGVQNCTSTFGAIHRQQHIVPYRLYQPNMLRVYIILAVIKRLLDNDMPLEKVDALAFSWCSGSEYIALW